MKIKLLTLLILISFTVFAQTENEKKELISKTNVKELLVLKNKFEKENLQKEERVNQFLQKNKTYKKTFKENGNLFAMIDVVNGNPVYLTNNNVGAAISSRTNFIQVGGDLGLDLEGENITVGVWDGGVALATHQEFNTGGLSRITYGQTVSSNDHATHVAGTIAANGSSANAKGMAPKANITSYDWFSDNTEIINEITSNAMILSNHSYGVPVGSSPTWAMGCFSDAARDWDQILYNAEYYLSVISAGNDGNTTYTGGLIDGFDKLVGNKNSKNALIIANANPFINSSSGALINLTINSSSSQGPTDDGRVKPDLTADGTQTFSPIDTHNTAYDTYTGTSMASPSVAGTLALLQEYYKQLNASFMKSATAKGLLIHTAERGALAAKGPSPIYGFGLINAKTAAELILNDSNGTAIVDERRLDNSNTYTLNFTTTGTNPIIATICWTDPAGTSLNGQNNSATSVLVNDLDIRISDGTDTYMPWKLDPADYTNNAIKGDNTVDNVEKIEITTPVVGSYTLTVTHKGTLSSNQNYSLFLSGQDVSLLSNNDHSFLSFKAYPNPIKNIFIIEGVDIISNVTVYNLLGQSVMDITPNKNNVKLDVENLKSGTYFVKVTINGSSETMKIIK